MLPISACIICFNEEDKIERCLQSLDGVVQEIVVVDSESADATRAIAARYTDRVIVQAFLGHVEQKNFAVDEASNEWILSLDADEVLSPELRECLLNLGDRIEAHRAWRVARKTHYIDRWLDHCWYPEWKIRLFDRRVCRWSGTNPHDHIEPPASGCGTLDGDLYHYSFDSISDHIRKLDALTDIAARELRTKGRPVRSWEPWTHATWAFVRNYLLRQGFRDGRAGLVVATYAYMYTFTKYVKALYHEPPSR